VNLRVNVDESRDVVNLAAQHDVDVLSRLVRCHLLASVFVRHVLEDIVLLCSSVYFSVFFLSRLPLSLTLSFSLSLTLCICLCLSLTPPRAFYIRYAKCARRRDSHQKDRPAKIAIYDYNCELLLKPFSFSQPSIQSSRVSARLPYPIHPSITRVKSSQVKVAAKAVRGGFPA